MAFNIDQNFNINSDIPIDSRYVRNTREELDSIEHKYTGLEVFVIEDKMKYWYDEEEDVWNECQYGSGGGGGGYSNNYVFQYCMKSDKTNPLYDYTPYSDNYDSTKHPKMSFNESKDEIYFSYYLSVQNTLSNTYKLFNSSGKLVKQGTINIGSGEIAISTKNLVSDLYALHVYNGSIELGVKDKQGNVIQNCLYYDINRTDLKVILYQESIDQSFEFNKIHNYAINSKANLRMFISKSDDIIINSILVDNKSVEFLGNNQAHDIQFTITGIRTVANIIINYQIENEDATNYTLSNVIYSVNGYQNYLEDVEISNKVNNYTKINLSGLLITSIPNQPLLYYRFKKENESYSNDWQNVSILSYSSEIPTEIHLLLPHNLSDDGNYIMEYYVSQSYNGTTYTTLPAEQLIVVEKFSDSSGPVINELGGEESLVMNFDINRTEFSHLTDNCWLDSAGNNGNANYKIQFYNLQHTDFVGNDVEEQTTVSDLSKQGDKFLRFFGDSYGKIYDINDNEFNLASLNVNPGKYNPNLKSGYTIEILFRTRYSGDLNSLSVKIGNLLNISYDTISGFLQSNIQFIENQWIHLVCVVNNDLYNDISETEALSSPQTVLPYKAIYINGIICKLEYNNSYTSTNLFNSSLPISFNLNQENDKTIYGMTDLKVFRIYKRPLSMSEILRNYHSCVTDESKRNTLISKNNLNNPSYLTEVYFIRNTGDNVNNHIMYNNNGSRKSNIIITTFEEMNGITNKAQSKITNVNCTVIIVSYKKNANNEYSSETSVYRNVEVSLQGTSTLAYIVKNYKIKLYNDQNVINSETHEVTIDSSKRKGKKKIQVGNPIDGFDINGEYNTLWKKEYTYTLKADYMESSHMNNTGVARLINDNVYKCPDTEVVNNYTFKTPSQLYSGDETMRIIIDGFPCVLYQVDDTNDCNDINELIELNVTDYNSLDIESIKLKSKLMGTYMFNLDKAAENNYGFELEINEDDQCTSLINSDNNKYTKLMQDFKNYAMSQGFNEEDANALVYDNTLKYPYIQSFEINANSANGAAGFFPFDNSRLNDEGKPFNTEYDYYIDTYEARYMYTEKDYVTQEMYDSYFAYEGVKINNDKYDLIKILPDEYVVPGYPVFYRDSGVWKKVSGAWNNVLDKNYYRVMYDEDNLCFNSIVQFVNFINNKKLLSSSTINKFLNVDFAMTYFIVTLSVGLVDNLGKNLMFNTWNINEEGIPFDPKYINPNNILNAISSSDLEDVNNVIDNPDINGSFYASNIPIWYASFYDMDTCLGLNNYGEEKVNSNAEPLVDKISGYMYKEMMKVYDATPELDSKYNSLSNIQIDNKPVPFEKYGYFPRELLDLYIALQTGNSELLDDYASNNDCIWIVKISNSSETTFNLGTNENPIIVKTDDWLCCNVSKVDSNYYIELSIKDTDYTYRYNLYSTPNSVLWNALCNYFYNDIYTLYSRLRKNTLTLNNVMLKLSENTFNAIPKNYYNYNAWLKYFRECATLFNTPGQTGEISKYVNMCNGDRQLKANVWLENRLNFVDTLLVDSLNMPSASVPYGQCLNIMPGSGIEGATLYLKSKNPQYMSIQMDTSGIGIRKYVDSELDDSGEGYGVRYILNTQAQVQNKISGVKDAINIRSLASYSPTDISLASMLYLNSIQFGDSLSTNKTLTSLTFNTSEDVIHGFKEIELHCNNSNFISLDLSRCLFLETLNLANCTNLKTLILPKNARLKTINLTNCFSLETLVVENLFQLSSLVLTNCNKLANLTIKNCKKLTSVNFNDISSNSIIIENTGISSISISTAKLSEFSVKGSSITSITLTNCQFKTANYVLDLSNCPNLVTLKLPGDLNLSGYAANIATIILPENTSSSTKTIQLVGCNNLKTIGYTGDLEENTFNFSKWNNGPSNGNKVTLSSGFRTNKFQKLKGLRTANYASELFRSCNYLTTIEDCKLHMSNGGWYCNGVGSSGNGLTTVTDISGEDQTFIFNGEGYSFNNYFNGAKLSQGFVSKFFGDYYKSCKSLHPDVTYPTLQLIETFFSCRFTNTNITSFNFKNFNITGMTNTFAGANITKISTELFNASQTNKIYSTSIFRNCTSLTSVILELFPNIFTSLEGAFYNCTALVSAPKIRHLTNLKNINYIFAYCSALDYKLSDANFTLKRLVDSERNNELEVNYYEAQSNKNFYSISCHSLSNLETAIAAYYNCGLSGSTDSYENGGEIINISCIPDNYFSSTIITSIESIFANNSNITTILPNNFIKQSITNASGIFANTGVSGNLNKEFFDTNANLKYLGPTGKINSGNYSNRNSLMDNNKILKGYANVRYSTKATTGYTGQNSYINPYNYNTYGAFQNTNIKFINEDSFDRCNQLESIACLFAHTSSGNSLFEGIENSNDYSITQRLLQNQTKLSNISYSFYKCKLSKMVDPNLLQNSPTSIVYIDCMIAYNNIEQEESYNLITISNCSNLISCRGLYAGLKNVILNGNGESPYDNINSMFKSLTKLEDVSFMFYNCGLSCTFTSDTLFYISDTKDDNGNYVSALKYAQHLFDQIHVNDDNGTKIYRFNNSNILVNSDESTSSETIPKNYVRLNKYVNNYSYQNMNYETKGNIIGKIPKYLFKDMINVENVAYMFSGTCVSGNIPSTIFDVSDNYTDMEVNYSGKLFDIEKNDGTYDHRTNVIFYKDPNGDYVYSGDTNITTGAYIMDLHTDQHDIGEIRYSYIDDYKYNVKTRKLNNLKYLSKITSVAGMFDYCTYIMHGSDETSNTINGYNLSTPFTHTGLTDITNTDEFDSIINDTSYRKYVIDDVSESLRAYCPDVDASKHVFIINDDGYELDGSTVVISTTNYTFGPVYSKVYFLNPNIFRYLNKLTSAAGFIRYCVNLQGVLPNSIFLYNSNLTSAASFCEGCVNLYGFYSTKNSNNINSLYEMFYNEDITTFSIQNISYMFAYCYALGYFKYEDGGVTEQNNNPYYPTTSVQKAIKNSNGIYRDGFLSWGTNPNYLLKSLTNMSYLFRNCNYLEGGLPLNMLKSNAQANKSLNTTGYAEGASKLSTTD